MWFWPIQIEVSDFGLYKLNLIWSFIFLVVPDHYCGVREQDVLACWGTKSHHVYKCQWGLGLRGCSGLMVCVKRHPHESQDNWFCSRTLVRSRSMFSVSLVLVLHLIVISSVCAGVSELKISSCTSFFNIRQSLWLRVTTQGKVERTC